jgi:uncharacterized protein YabE (DUF348 family)/3D (Asp-Asp-Asp) domain-containing protein
MGNNLTFWWGGYILKKLTEARKCFRGYWGMKRKRNVKPLQLNKALAAGILYTAEKPVITEKELSLGEQPKKSIGKRFVEKTREKLERLFYRWISTQYDTDGLVKTKRIHVATENVQTHVEKEEKHFYGWFILAICVAVFVATFVVPAVFRMGIHTFTVKDGGRTLVAETKAKTVGEFLEGNGIVLGAYDVIDVALESEIKNDMEVVIKRALPVTIQTNGESTEVMMLTGTVAEALARANIEIGERDETYPALDSYVRAGTVIDVVEVLEETIIEYEVLHYKEITKKDSSLAKGKTKTVTAGVNGLERHTIQVIYKNGTEVSRTVVNTEVIKSPVDEVVHVGTYVPPVTTLPTPSTDSSSGSGTVSTPSTPAPVEDVGLGEIDDSGKLTKVPSVSEIHASGDIHEHKQAAEPASSIIAKTVVIDHITAYSGAGSPTATGTHPRIGTIAADPKRFPYGTKVYVPGYGYGRIEDTGGFRNESYTLFDLFMPNESDCKAWGRKRNIKVYILKDS